MNGTEQKSREILGGVGGAGRENRDGALLR